MSLSGRLVKLGEVVDFQNGGGFKASEFTKTGIPLIRVSDFELDTINIENCIYLSFDSLPVYNRFLLQKGDVVISTVGSWPTSPTSPVGKVVYVTKEIEGCLLNQNAVRLRFIKDVTEQKYIRYLAKSEGFKHHIAVNARGSANHARIAIEVLKQYEFTLPPLHTQRRIAEILGRLDDKIEVNRRINRTLEAMAQALYKHWFVDFGPFQAGEFVESELGLIPQGWRVATLEEAVDINPLRSLRRGQIAPYLDMANMPTSSARALNWIQREFNSGMRFLNGDVLVARITPCLENGKTAYVDFLEDGQVGWESTEYIVLRSKPPLPIEFAYLFARTKEFRSHAIQHMTGTSGRQRVSADSLKMYQIIVPTEDVAKSFDERVKNSFKVMKQLDQESAKLTEIRNYLLPKLLSGEIPVEVVKEG